MKYFTTKFYNSFSFLYPVIDVFLKSHKDLLFEEINKLDAGTLLDIGVGNGSHVSGYIKHEIIGVDSSSRMLEKAKELGLADVKFMVMDGESLKFRDNSFDYIVMSHVLAVTSDPDKLLQESFRVLKSQGKLFVLNHFTPNNWLKIIDFIFIPFSVLFRFKSYFKIEKFSNIKKFKLEKEIKLGKLDYFKLLIYNKL